MEGHWEALVLRAQSGDQEAFTALMAQSEQMLSRVAIGILKDPDDGADAVQEAVFKAWRNLDRLRRPKYFKTWLTKILIRECYGVLAQRKKHLHGQLEAELDSAEELVDQETALDVRAAMEGLKKNDQLLLGLYYGDGLAVREISKLLDISETAVRQRLHRGRERFQAAYLGQEEHCHEK